MREASILKAEEEEEDLFIFNVTIEKSQLSFILSTRALTFEREPYGLIHNRTLV